MIDRRLSHYAGLFWAFILLLLEQAPLSAQERPTPVFPAELTQFVPYEHNPVFKSGGAGAWDARIRERGWILRESGNYRMWYTGYDGTREGLRMLGYATSTDGIHWTRYPMNPLDAEHWIEDMMVVKRGSEYFMFAEGVEDRAHLFTSPDGISWTRIGPLDIRREDGSPLSEGPRGTPTAWHGKGVWYLFYERGDKGVWLATSTDMNVWTNVSDEPVLALGPGEYDREMIALNQIISHQGHYYAYYHGSGDPPGERRWSPCLAASDDLIHWTKYPGNPLIPASENKSSGIVVPHGDGYWFYTMHDQVDLYVPFGKN